MEKIAKNLISLIELWDYWRPSKKFFVGRMLYKITPFSVNRIRGYDPKLGDELDLLIKEHRKRIGKDFLTNPRISGTLFVLTVVYVSILHILPESFSNQGLLLWLLSAGSLCIILILPPFLIVTINEKNKFGLEYDADLKSQNQKNIDYSRNFLRENNLNPKDFSIELRHNDYEGLTYESKGRGFLAYIQLK